MEDYLLNEKGSVSLISKDGLKDKIKKILEKENIACVLEFADNSERKIYTEKQKKTNTIPDKGGPKIENIECARIIIRDKGIECGKFSFKDIDKAIEEFFKDAKAFDKNNKSKQDTFSIREMPKVSFSG